MSQPRVALEIGQGEETWGTIVLELDDAATPATAANFLQYVDDGFFDGTIFHRVISNFMIQGGGYTAPNTDKRGGRDPIQNEAQAGLKNERGTIAMARTDEPHSATNQFFINTANNAMLDHPAHDGWGYCAFGKVADGMSIVERIESVKTRPSAAMGGEDSEPVDPPRIVRASRVRG